MQLGRRKACLSLSGKQVLYAMSRTEAIEISQDSVTAGCVFAQLRPSWAGRQQQLDGSRTGSSGNPLRDVSRAFAIQVVWPLRAYFSTLLRVVSWGVCNAL